MRWIFVKSSGGGLPSPTRWYDASDAATVHLSGSDITQWDDKGTSPSNATVPGGAVNPTYALAAQNGLNSVNYAFAVLQYFDCGSSAAIHAATGFTVLAVMTPQNTGSSRCLLSVKNDQTNNLKMELSAGGSPGNFFFGSDTVWASGSVTSGLAGDGVAQLVALNYNGSGAGTVGNYDYYLNSVAKTISGSSFSETSGNFLIGSLNANPAENYKGYIHEIQIYEPALSPGDLSAISAALTTKWGL